MINHLELSGYRLLDGFSADLGQLTVVIGANATGKSTLIDGLQLISEMMSFAMDDAISNRWGMLSVASADNPMRELRWALQFSRPADHELWSKMPIQPDRPYVYEVTIRPDATLMPESISEVLRTYEPFPGHKKPFVLLQSDDRGSRLFDPKRKELVPFDQAASNDASDDGSSLSTISSLPAIPTDEKRWLLLSRMRFLNEFPQQTWVRALLANLYYYPGFFEVGKSASIRTKPAEIRPTTALGSTGDNLGTVLHELFTRHSYHQSAEMFREFLRTAYPFFDNIYAETAYGAEPRVLVRLREKGIHRAIELWEVSDGMLRFLCLAAALLNPVPPAMVAIDEPETGLHPKLLPIVADMIKAAAERSQVLVTTHSPSLLNCFDLDSIAVMTREESKARWFRPAERESLRKMLDSVTGDSLGDLHRSGELEALA